jgi:RecA/RadA recombinase
MAKATFEDLRKKYSGEVVVNKVSTGNVVIDRAWGGGFPLSGRVTLLSGAQAAGKTTLAAQTIRYWIETLSLKVGYLDSETAMTPELMDNLGLTQYLGAGLEYFQAYTYSDIEEILDVIVIDKIVDVIVIDSIAQVGVDINFDKGSEEKHQIGITARTCQNFFQKWKGRLSEANIGTLLINQARNQINTNKFDTAKFPQEVFKGLKPWGASSLEHVCDIRTWMQGGKEIIDENGVEVGRNTMFHVTKSKFSGQSFIPLEVIYGKKVTTTLHTLQTAIRLGAIDQGGGWFTINEYLLDYIEESGKTLKKSLSKKIRKSEVLPFVEEFEEDIVHYLLENQAGYILGVKKAKK